jgi:hypothetical protein
MVVGCDPNKFAFVVSSTLRPLQFMAAAAGKLTNVALLVILFITVFIVCIMFIRIYTEL